MNNFLLKFQMIQYQSGSRFLRQGNRLILSEKILKSEIELPREVVWNSLNFYKAEY